MNKENKPKESKIRLNGKQHFYTYAQCDVDLEALLGFLRRQWSTQNIEVVHYIVAHELHKDGFPHRHVYLELNSPPIGNQPANWLDWVAIGGRRYHGNYQTVRNIERVIGYTTKAGDFITSFSDTELSKFQAKYLSLQQKKVNKAEIGQRLLNGESVEAIVEEYPQLLFDYMKLKNAVNLYVSNTRKLVSLPKLENEWRWGDTGIGKSKCTREEFPEAFIKNKELYWNGYQHEKVAILEDVDLSWQPVIEQFKIWADHYPFKALIKLGDPIMLRPEKIIVTSNYTIEELVEKMGIKDPIFVKALERRFKQVYIAPVEDIITYDKCPSPLFNWDL